MSNFEFKKGTKVEITSDEEGFIGAWFSGTIITPPTKTTKKVLVEYDTLLSENGSKPLREKVDLVQTRPTPPREIGRIFNLDENVDAFYNDGWWEGVVTQVLDDFNYSVYFSPTKEQSEFNGSDLRLHREWDNGKWIPPLDEETQPTDATIYGGEENLFSKGSQVEVSSDEDGFGGAWFAANVIDVLGNDKFLVEYRDLMTEDNRQFVREEVDAFHIRPCPPKANVDKFKESEEVDALYNDGWWVGVISEVLGPSKYEVYFRNTGEEMKFKHEELRIHQDWTNGKWVVVSKAMNLS